MDRMLLIVFLFIFLVLASMKRWKLAVAAMAVGLAATLLLIHNTVRREDSAAGAPTPTRVHYAGVLAPVLADPELVRHLASVHHLTLNAHRMSGHLDPSESSVDGVWFEDPARVAPWADRHPDPDGQARTVYSATPVYLTWPEVLDFLIRNGVAERRGSEAVLTAPERLREWIAAKRDWRSLGLRDQDGPVGCRSVTPDAGEAGRLAGEATAEMCRADGGSAAEVFEEALRLGRWAAPLVFTEDWLLVTRYTLEPQDRERLAGTRVITPVPTRRHDYVYLGVTTAGKRLASALRSPETARLMAERFGLHLAGSPPVAAPAGLEAVGLPGVSRDASSKP